MDENYKRFTDIKIKVTENNEYRICMYEDGEYIRYSEKGLEKAMNKLLRKNEELNHENEHLIRKRGELETKNTILKGENKQLKQENQRMTNKLNEVAFEFLDYDMITMGKATEISEMCYHDFLKYRKERGNSMELQL